MKQSDRAAIIATIESYLAYMELAVVDRKTLKGGTGEHNFPLTVFTRAEPFGVSDVGIDQDADGRVYTYEEQDPTKLVPRIDVTLLTGSIATSDHFTLRRVRTLTDAEKRGRIKPWVPIAVEEHAARVNDDGSYMPLQDIWGWYGGKWQGVKDYGSRTFLYSDDFTERGKTGRDTLEKGIHIGWAHQHAVYRQMLWHVVISYADRASSLMIPCEASAIPDLFKTRDLPEGKSKRDAILHWVAEHWRRVRTSPEVSREITAYLRGKTDFQWSNGLRVRVYPAADDIVKLVPSPKKKQLTAERAEIQPALTDPRSASAIAR